VSNFEHVNFAIDENYSKKIMIIQIIMLYSNDFSNIQKCNFKKNQLGWFL
jgi:hypothetical protein